jgi:uncharacterized membrane protein YqaE (UPF0057 family)
MNPEQKLCLFCHFPVAETYYFCPNCGKNLKAPPVSTTIFKQIGIYALSIFLPPLGLWPGIKYLRQNSQRAKTVGLVAIILTIISTIITVWLAIGMFNQVGQSLMNQGILNQYQNLGL